MSSSSRYGVGNNNNNTASQFDPYSPIRSTFNGNSTSTNGGAGMVGIGMGGAAGMGVGMGVGDESYEVDLRPTTGSSIASAASVGFVDDETVSPPHSHSHPSRATFAYGHGGRQGGGDYESDYYGSGRDETFGYGIGHLHGSQQQQSSQQQQQQQHGGRYGHGHGYSGMNTNLGLGMGGGLGGGLGGLGGLGVAVGSAMNAAVAAAGLGGLGAGAGMGLGPAGNNNLVDASKTYSFVSLPGNTVRKRPRRRYDEIERLYQCSFSGCTKAYGTLNHLNAHVSMQRHGQKRHPSGKLGS